MHGFLKGRLLLVRLCLLAAVLILIGIGIATIYSAGNPAEHSPDSQVRDLSAKWEKQIVFAMVGLAGFLVVNSVNYRRFGSVSYWIFAGVLVLLVILLISKYVVVLPFAKPIHGTYRWISFTVAGRPSCASWRIFWPWHGT
jgi:cell division protein FtsW (lipid II flippase)